MEHEYIEFETLNEMIDWFLEGLDEHKSKGE